MSSIKLPVFDRQWQVVKAAQPYEAGSAFHDPTIGLGGESAGLFIPQTGGACGNPQSSKASGRAIVTRIRMRSSILNRLGAPCGAPSALQRSKWPTPRSSDDAWRTQDRQVRTSIEHHPPGAGSERSCQPECQTCRRSRRRRTRCPRPLRRQLQAEAGPADSGSRVSAAPS